MNAKSLAAELGAVQVIDVREDFEWDAGRIEGSVHIPMRDLPVRLGEIDGDKPAVAVCYAGGRSAHASQFLTSQGLQTGNLEGGLKSWVREGLPLVTGGGGPGRLVHDPPAPGSGYRPQTEGSPAKASQTEIGESSSQREGSGESSSQTEESGESSSQTEESGGLPPDMEALKNDFIEVVFAAGDRFGDREPSEREIRLFMKEWLISKKGKTPEEAEQILDR